MTLVLTIAGTTSVLDSHRLKRVVRTGTAPQLSSIRQLNLSGIFSLLYLSRRGTSMST